MKQSTFNAKVQLYEEEFEELILHTEMGKEIPLEFPTRNEAYNYRARLYRYCALLKENEDKVKKRLYLAAINTMILMRGKKIVIKHRQDSPYRQGLKDAIARAGGDPEIVNPWSQENIARRKEERDEEKTLRNTVVPVVETQRETPGTHKQTAQRLGFGKIDPDAIEREQQNETEEALHHEQDESKD